MRAVLFHSIRTKTAVLFFLAFLIIILPANWLVYQKVESALVDTNQRELAIEAGKLLSMVRLDPLTIPVPAEGYMLSLRVKDAHQSEVLFSSPGFPTLDEMSLIQTRVEADTLEIVNVERSLGRANATLTLSLGRSATLFLLRLASVRFYLFVANVLAILLAGLLVLLVSGWILKPVRNIARAAVSIRNSSDITSIPLPGTQDESRQLAEAINSMLQRIQQSVREQTNFFSSAAHELRTPLAVMKAELTLVSAENASVKISALLPEVERLERVIHDFLLISELKAETLAIRRKNEDLGELVYSALRKVRYASEEYGTRLQLQLASETEYVIFADADKLQTVIANLIENAIKYAPRQSVVSISLQTIGSHYSLEVINPTHQTIDEPDLYRQEYRKSEELSSGLGMGLWICDQIVGLHGFSLELASRDKMFTAKLTAPRA